MATAEQAGAGRAHEDSGHHAALGRMVELLAVATDRLGALAALPDVVRAEADKTRDCVRTCAESTRACVQSTARNGSGGMPPWLLKWGAGIVMLCLAGAFALVGVKLSDMASNVQIATRAMSRSIEADNNRRDETP